MAEHQEKLKKLFNARSNLESELCNIHMDKTDAIDRQDRKVKVERLVSKLKDVFSKLVQKNEELFDLASKAENPDSLYPVLEQWFMIKPGTMINSCLRLEAILTQLLTETPYVRALILKANLREVNAEQHHQCLASVNMKFSWQN